jgi:peptidoglycan/LPS O-acetylase OafA/YrhL
MFSERAEAIAAYTFTVARWDAIALGAVVAIVMRDPRLRSQLNAHVGTVLGASLLCAAGVTAYERGFPAMGRVTESIGQPLASIASAALVLACALASTEPDPNRTSRSLARLFSPQWLRTIGKYSYAIYIFQTPVRLVLLAHAPAGLDVGSPTERFTMLLAFIVMVFLVSLALAVVTWRVLESPLLSLKRYFPRPA